MRLDGYGVGSAALLLAVLSACGGGSKTPASAAAGSGGSSAGGSQTSGGAGGTAGANDAGAGRGGTGDAGSPSQGGGGQAGAAGAAGCQLLKEGESGQHGLTQVYTAVNSGSALSALGLDGDQAYFNAEGKLFGVPVAGGPAKSLGAFGGDHALVLGGKVYAVSPLSQEPTRKLFSSPLGDLTTQTTLADGIEDPYRLIADDTALYYDRRQSSSIFQVPIAGGTPVELVPGAQPSAMASQGGYLYWLDQKTAKLERVPVAGGPREPLVDSDNGGTLVATDKALYWIGGVPSIIRWELGASKTEVLSKNVETFGGYQDLAVSGDTVYWVYGFECGQVRQVSSDGTGEALFAQGTNATEWLGVTDNALFVMGGIGSNVYRADR